MAASPQIKFSFGPLAPSSPRSLSVPPLFDGWCIVLAHILGGPLGSCTILAMNFSRLGQRKTALLTMGLGLLLMIAVLLAFGEQWISLLVAATIVYFEEGFQRSRLEQCIRSGAPLRSTWFACLIGIACGMVLVVCLFIELFVRI